MLENSKVELRLFVRVTAFVAVVPTVTVPKLRLRGETDACTTPVPLRVTSCGLLLALSVMVSNPLRTPKAVGENVTLMTQCVPRATVTPQVFV